MKKNVYFGSLLSLALCVISSALPKPPGIGKGSSSPLFLFDLSKKKPARQMGPLLAYRVYSRYLPSLGKWGWTLTDRHRNFAEPPEILQPDSILPGRWIGAPNQNQHYHLIDENKWVPTEAPVRVKVLVLSTPWRVKTLKPVLASSSNALVGMPRMAQRME